MPRMKVDATTLQQFLDAGHSQADAATHFGVSQAAISQRVKQARIATSKVVALERAAQVVDQQLSASARLERIQQVIDGELACALVQAHREGADRAGLQDVILRLAGEVRQQLGLQLAISRALVDLRVLKEFQETVIEVIREESSQTAHRIFERLKQRLAAERRPANLGRTRRRWPCGVTRWTNSLRISNARCPLLPQVWTPP